MSVQAPLYNKEGKEAGSIALPEALFNIPLNTDLVHQAMVYYEGSKRQVIAHTKTRGEVSGGGKKPWAQKHTGRARHGSIRSPIWIGGGITFGPRNERVFAKKLNKKMRRKALFAVLSEKARKNLILVVDELKAEKGKTKAIREFLGKLPCDQQKILIALPAMDTSLIQSVRNLGYAKAMQAKDLNAYDALSARYIIIPKDAVKVLEKTFANAKKQK